MSREGDRRDNAVVEGCFSALKRDPVRREGDSDREETMRSPLESIDMFKNHRRRHSTLGHRNPAEFEARSA